MEEKKPSDRKGPRELGLRMDRELELAMVASAKKYERTLSQEARYQLRLAYGLIEQEPAGDEAGMAD